MNTPVLTLLYRVCLMTILSALLAVTTQLYVAWHTDNQTMSQLRTDNVTLKEENDQLYNELVKLGEKVRGIQKDLEGLQRGEDEQTGVRRLGRRSA